MILPPTPITPSSGLRSPISIDGSQTTLINNDDEMILRKEKVTSVSNASLVLEKLQQILEPDEFADSVGKAPNIVVIGRESAGKSSVLNALTAVPLYVAAGTATRGPMKIASIRTGQPFRASVSIEAISSVGTSKRHTFTLRPILDLVSLRSAIKLAGDEARRLEIGSEARTFECLQLMSERERMADSQTWSDYTMNTVIVNISAPDQVDLHMTDLPGLGRAASADAVANMINHHISKPENVIVHCMAACGGSPGNNECVQLNIAADPTGERSMIVLTQVDRIDDPSEDPWTGILTGQSDAFDGWSPKLGAHAVRLAGPRELKAGLVASQVRAIEQQLFSSSEWVDIARKAKVGGFGVAVVRQKVLDLHEDRIAQWLRGVPKLLQGKRQSTTLAKSLLPSLPDDPIAAIHQDVIRQFGIDLKSELAIRGPACRKLAEVQEGLIKSLNSAVLAVIPLFKKDAAKQTSLTTAFGYPMSSITSSHQTKVWIDDLILLRNEYRSARNGRYDDAAILAKFVKETVERWDVIISTYLKQVWAIIDKCVEEIGNRRPSTSNIISQAMRQLQEDRLADSQAFIHTILAVTASDPATTAVKDDHLALLVRNGGKYTNSNFEKLYRTPSLRGTPPAEPLPPAESLTVPEGISNEVIREVLRLQAEIDAHLGSAVYRVGTLVGQKVQVDLLSYIDQAEARLRVAFDLERVEPSIRKRAAGLFETKTDRVKRAKVLEKEKSLSEIEAIVQEALTA